MAQFNPEDIDSFIKALNAMNAIHPWIGTAVAIVGLITGSFTAYNTIKTKLNTKANDQTAKLLTEHATAIKAHDDRMTAHEKKIQEMEEAAAKNIQAMVDKATVMFTAATSEIVKDVRATRLGVMKIKTQVESQLSMIPTVQAAIERETKRNTEILSILTKGKTDGGPK